MPSTTIDGDSGSLIWDINGYVAALVWGGPNTNVTYATPIGDVLDDIREACGAKEVKLIVKSEDETDVVFGPPERQPIAMKASTETEATTEATTTDESFPWEIDAADAQHEE
jgi:hypothetical protein